MTEVKILQSWHGDFPVNQLYLLPEDQRERAIGYISDQSQFGEIWDQFKPDLEIPEINFEHNLVLFARNIQFYNRISIAKIKLTDGVAEVLAMETMSALPIKENVAISFVVVPRQGINAIQIGEEEKILIQ